MNTTQTNNTESNIPEHWTVCPETGLFVERYVSSYYDNWEPQLPEGFVVFDDRIDYSDDDEYLKWHENNRIRRIGREVDVLLAAVADIPGVTFTPAVAA